MTHAAEQWRRVRAGAVATLVISTFTGVVWGSNGWIDGVTMGAVATLMQLVAAHAMRRTGITPSVDHLGVYAMGMLFRALGVVALAVLTIRYPERFLPGPSAVGYLGAVLPLLYVETRLSR